MNDDQIDQDHRHNADERAVVPVCRRRALLSSPGSGGDMASGREPLQRVLGELNPAWFGNPVRELQLFQTCTSVAEVRAVFREQVELEVSAMADLVADADAFDVIELMRMREFPPVPDPRVEMADGTALAVEIVAAVLLARPSRKPDPRPRRDTRPHERVPELHERSRRLSRLATYRQLLEARMSNDALPDLAAEYQGAVLNIRNLQYEHIRRDHEARLFDNPTVEPLMREFLGYTHADLVAVRSAMAKLSADRMTKLRDDSAEILMRYPDVPPDKVPPEEIAAFMNLMIPFMFLPADRAVFSTSDIAEAAGLTSGSASAVLDSYAQTFDDTIPPSTRVFDLLLGANPFLITPLVSDGDGNFVATTNDVGLDSLRRIFEKALPANSPAFKRYDRNVRQVVSEQLALRHIETILRIPPAYTNFQYFAPKSREQLTQLGRDCGNLNEDAKQVEGDGLFLIDDVAIVVEVKGKSMAAQAGRGDVRRLTNDLKATVGEACDQAVRLQNLIDANGGLWLGDRTWLDLSHLREVRSITALLDDIGPLGTAIGDLQRAGIITQDRPPWIASLHDLATIAEICGQPAEFLLYLRRRTDSGVTTHYRALDELDLYMLFLEGNLYVEPDPEDVKRQHASAPRVKNRDRRRHQSDAVGTMVADHCHELNAWMQRARIPEHEEPPSKPTFNVAPALLDVIGPLAEQQAPGWLRCCADLLGLAGEAQRKIVKSLKECARLTRGDDGYHDGVLSFAGLWGHPSLFFATHSRGSDPQEAQNRLLTYMRAKRHQLRSDRVYGLLFDEHTTLEQVIYLNTPLSADPEMDALVESMGLQPVGDKSRPVPPSARRVTRRLRGTGKKR